MSVLHLTAAVLAATAGVALLHGAWRRRLPRAWLPVPAGWTLLGASAWFWVAGAGAEFGVTLALLATSLVAWLFVWQDRQRRERRGRQDTAPKVADGRSLAEHALLFVLVVPLAAVASALVSTALSLALPVSEVNAMVIVLAVMPVLWGAAAWWSVADPRPLRPAAALTIGALAGAVIIHV
tara:strand:+ start:4861 stop:5403 length:543 start_codon:yes stop_codon:yes gene_type:complete